MHTAWGFDVRNLLTSELAERVRTRLAVPIHELPAAFGPLFHDVLYRVESREPPFVRHFHPGTVDDNLDIIRGDTEGGGGDNQESELDELSEGCFHTGRTRSNGRRETCLNLERFGRVPFSGHSRSSETLEPLGK